MPSRRCSRIPPSTRALRSRCRLEGAVRRNCANSDRYHHLSGWVSVAASISPRTVGNSALRAVLAYAQCVNYYANCVIPQEETGRVVKSPPCLTPLLATSTSRGIAYLNRHSIVIGVPHRPRPDPPAQDTETPLSRRRAHPPAPARTTAVSRCAAPDRDAAFPPVTRVWFGPSTASETASR